MGTRHGVLAQLHVCSCESQSSYKQDAVILVVNADKSDAEIDGSLLFTRVPLQQAARQTDPVQTPIRPRLFLYRKLHIC